MCAKAPYRESIYKPHTGYYAGPRRSKSCKLTDIGATTLRHAPRFGKLIAAKPRNGPGDKGRGHQGGVSPSAPPDIPKFRSARLWLRVNGHVPRLNVR